MRSKTISLKVPEVGIIAALALHSAWGLVC